MVDLLRGGEHSTEVPLEPLRRAAGALDYHVCLRLFHVEDAFFVYPIHLDVRLPTIEVPLLPETPSVEVDLQAVFDRAYEAGRYRRKVRYDASEVSALSPPLETEKVAWLKSVLLKERTAPGKGG